MAAATSHILPFLTSNWQVIAASFCVFYIVKILISLAKWYLSSQRVWDVIKDMPDTTSMLKGAEPTVTNVLSLSSACGKLFTRWPNPFGHTILAHHPDSSKCVLAGVDKKESIYWRLIKPFVGDSVLASKGDKWFKSRKLLTPAFHFGALKGYVHKFQQTMLPVLDKWSANIKRGETSINVTADIDDLTLKALLKCAFGDFPLTGKQQQDVKNALHDISFCFTKRVNSWNFFLFLDTIYYLTPDGRRFRKAVNTMRDLGRLIVRQKQKEFEQGITEKKKYKDFLDIIIQTRDEAGNALTEEELLDEVNTFFFAGHDTTASALPFIFYNLARHPEYQEKCRNEIEEKLHDQTELNWESLANLQFVNMCIKESLRLHPPVWGISRQSAQPITMGDGGVIPTNSEIGVNIYGVLHNPDVWKDPEVYDPYRFHPKSSDSKHPYAFIPFSAGQRNCIGMNFALTEIRVCVVTTLRRFRLSLDTNRPVKMELKITLKAEGGMWIKMEEI